MRMARRNSRHSWKHLRLEKGFFYSFNVRNMYTSGHSTDPTPMAVQADLLSLAELR